MKKRNYNHDHKVDDLNKQLINWQQEKMDKRAIIVMTLDEDTNEVGLSEAGKGVDLISLLAHAINESDDFRNQVHLALVGDMIAGKSRR